MSATVETSDSFARAFKPWNAICGWRFNALWKALAAICRWTHSQTDTLLARRASRRLIVAETLSLGEKRFVSIVCVDGEQFLLGGGPSNIVLLAKLEGCKTGTLTNAAYERIDDGRSHGSVRGSGSVAPIVRSHEGNDL